MSDYARFELMKKDLCKAASTIHRLKQERNEYKIAYELMKEDMEKKRGSGNIKHLEELRDINESLQQELMRFQRALLERDRSIAKLEQQLLESEKKVASHMKSLKSIEIARKELNYELSTTQFKQGSTKYNEIVGLVDNFIYSLKTAPAIYEIFKKRVQCKKKFISLVESGNYSLSFTYLIKFVVELLSTFQFCDEAPQEFDSVEECEEVPYKAEYLSQDSQFYRLADGKLNRAQEKAASKSKNNSAIKQKIDKIAEDSRRDSENTSSRIEKLNGELKRLSGSRIFSQDPEKKLSSSQSSVSCYSKPSLSLNIKGLNNVIHTETDQIGNTELSYREFGSEEGTARSVNIRGMRKSKSPMRQSVSPKSRFEEYQVPFKKIQGSNNIEECLKWN